MFLGQLYIDEMQSGAIIPRPNPISTHWPQTYVWYAGIGSHTLFQSADVIQASKIPAWSLWRATAWSLTYNIKHREAIVVVVIWCYINKPELNCFNSNQELSLNLAQLSLYGSMYVPVCLDFSCTLQGSSQRLITRHCAGLRISAVGYPNRSLSPQFESGRGHQHQQAVIPYQCIWMRTLENTS